MQKPVPLQSAAMKSQCLVVILLIVTIGGNSFEEVEDCEIRFEDNGACACSSHDTAGPVTQYDNSDRSIMIEPCYCMYYDSTQNLSIVGHCYCSCYKFHGTVTEIPAVFSLTLVFAVSIYGHLNRSGRFCGQCSAGYGLAV